MNYNLNNIDFTSPKTFFVPGFTWLTQSETSEHLDFGEEFTLLLISIKRGSTKC